MAEAKKTNYGNESISSLKGADRVRKRPGVIFGSDGLDGCEHAVFEILSNSIDEAREGHGKLITVTRYLDHSIEVEDDVTAYFEYPNGATGVFITTTADAPGTNRLEITGTKATLICQDGKLIMKKLEMDEREWCATCQEGFRAPSYETIEVETDGQNGQHPAVLNAFAAHILRGEPLVADGREGINGLMLSNAIHLSSWLGHPVTLPIDEKLFLEKLNERRATSRVKTGESVFSDTNGTYGSK